MDLFALNLTLGIKLEHAKEQRKLPSLNFQVVIHKFKQRLIKAHNSHFTASERDVCQLRSTKKNVHAIKVFRERIFPPPI